MILAGGLGTRLGEYTDTIPKPMVPIGGRPILWHIMNHYASFGHKDFVIALGYRGDSIKQHFLNMPSVASDFTINTLSGDITVHNSASPDWNVTLVDTGLDSLTGTRLRKLKEFVQDEPFFLTYGDGLSNVNLDGLIDFHKESAAMITMTAVRPPARFGELSISKGMVEKFKEKPQLISGWINGGFFVVEPEFIDLIPEVNVMLEREPLEAATLRKGLAAYQHEGFWQCMDTKRDKDMLQALWEAGDAPWLNP